MFDSLTEVLVGLKKSHYKESWNRSYQSKEYVNICSFFTFCCSFLLLYSFIYLHNIKFMAVYWTGMVIVTMLHCVKCRERKSEKWAILYFYSSTFSLFPTSLPNHPPHCQTTGAERQYDRLMLARPPYDTLLSITSPLAVRSTHTWWHLIKKTLAVHCPVLRVLSNAVHF